MLLLLQRATNRNATEQRVVVLWFVSPHILASSGLWKFKLLVSWSNSDKGRISRWCELLDSTANGEASGPVKPIGLVTLNKWLKEFSEVGLGEKVGSDGMGCIKEKIRTDLSHLYSEKFTVENGGVPIPISSSINRPWGPRMTPKPSSKDCIESLSLCSLPTVVLWSNSFEASVTSYSWILLSRLRMYSCRRALDCRWLWRIRARSSAWEGMVSQ